MNSQGQILILEDDPFREQEFRRVLGAHAFAPTILADPIRFLLELLRHSEHPARVRVLSLDHDLTRQSRPCGIESLDCGCAVVEFMCHMKPFCPVLVHSQNDIARRLMAERLQKAGWQAREIIDDPNLAGSWIENAWLPEIQRASAGTA